MTNFDTARDALETSLNSSGSAMREHEKWQQSLEAQINKLKASWQGLSQAFLSSDFLHGALDAVIGLVDGLTNLIDTFGAFPTLMGTVAAGFSAFKNKGFVTFDKDAKSIQLLGNNLMGLGGSFKKISTAVNTYNSNLSKSTGLQNAYVNAINNQNSSLGQYLSGLNGAKASFGGYIKYLFSAKAATIGLSIASTALNAALTMGLSFAIQLVVEGISKLINADKELAESVEEITSKFKQEHDELKKLKGDYDTTNESSMISKYEKLSKGVDNLGRNVSLTADEYSEYQSIVNKIAEQIPSLVTGYDSQGNAILSCKGNVEELTEAYEKLIHAQNNEIFNNVQNIGKDFKNAVKDSEDGGFWNNKLTSNGVKALEEIYENNYTTKEIHDLLDSIYDDEGVSLIPQIGKALEESGVEVSKFLGIYTWDGVEQAIADTMETDPELIKGIIDGFNTDLETLTEGMKSIAQATLSDAFDISGSEYYDMSDTMQSVAKTIVSGFDFEFYKQFKDDPLSVKTYINDMLDQLKTIENKDGAKIETAFNLKTQFNGGEVTYGEYAKGIQEAKNIIDGLELDDEVKNTIKLSLDDSDIQTQYNHIRGYLTEQLEYRKRDIDNNESASDYKHYRIEVEENAKADIDAFLNSLTADELAAVIDIKTEIDWANTDAEEIRKQIEDQVKLNKALNFATDIEVDATALEALNTALSESASAMGLTEESIDSLKSKYSDLEGYNPHTLFEKTANGVKVNRDELAKLEKKYNDLKKTEVQEHLDNLVEEYNKCTKAIDGNIGSTEKLELINKREKYAKQIEELAEYQAQLEGVTGAYQRWIDAQNTPEDYEGYEKVATSREDIRDEISRGFLSNSTKEYIDLLSGEDLVGGTIDDYANAWARLDKKVTSTGHSIHDFFTVNDDGDITSTGIDRFFNDIKKDFKGEVYKLNEETGEYYYDFSEKNLKAIQDEWGIGIDAIELLLEAAAAAGYDIDWGGIFDDLDLDTSNFESLVSVAEKAQKELNKLEGYEDLDFNFSTTTIEAATSELEKAQKTYNDLVTGDNGKININAKGADQARIILATLLVQKQQLEDSEIAINISTSGLDESQAKAVAWVQDFRTKYKNLEIAISTGEGIEEAKTELEIVKTSLDGLDDSTAEIAAQLVLGEGADGDGFRSQVSNAINSVGEQDINVGFKLDETAISDLNSNLLSNFTVDATAKITNVDKSQLEMVETGGMVNWTENTDGVSKSFEADGTVNWDDNIKNVKTSFSANGTVKWTSGNNVKVKVISEANGTANVNGTAFAGGSTSGRAFKQGDWGIKGSGTALVGEIGAETLVRSGRYYLVGESGAQFIQYRPNDIIFNHKQTEELFKYGKVLSDGGRGKVYANGSAFAQGSYPSSGDAYWQATSTSKSSALRAIARKKVDKAVKKAEEAVKEADSPPNNPANNSDPSYSATALDKTNALTNVVQEERAKEEKKEFEEVFDWIETAISRIEREIDNLDRTANSTYKSWSERNKALASEISKVSEEIKLQNNAAQEYLKEANSVGLDESWAKKVREGTLDIDTLNEKNSSEELIEKIKNYQKWYELYLDCIDAAEELREEEAKLYEQRFENVQSRYDGILQGFEHTETMLNEYINQAEAKGQIISKNYYNALIANEKDKIKTLKQEQIELLKKRDEFEAHLVSEGATLEEVHDTQSWRDMCAEIDEVTQSIEAANTATIEWANNIRDIEWEIFDTIQERISDITAEADFLIELMSNKDLFDDKGKLTSQGVATMALHGQNYNSYMYQADDYGKQVAEIDKQLEKGYSKDLEDRRRELIGLQRDMILAAEDEKNAIRDLVEEGINLELEALDEKIQKYEDALQSQKDLYDYQKRVEEQTKNIATIQKQLSAYEGDNSEEAKAKIQELKVSLEEAEADLEETEYDKYISDQSALLDNLYTEYELLLNERIDNTDALIQQVINGINAAAILSTEQNNSLLTALGSEGDIAKALGVEGDIAKAIVNAVAKEGSIHKILEEETTAVGTTLSSKMNEIWTTEGTGTNSVLATYGKGFQDKQTTTNDALSDIKADVAAMVDDVDKEAKTKVDKPKTQPSSKADPVKGTTNNGNKSNGDKTPDSKTLTEDKLMGIAASIWIDGHKSGWGNDPIRSGKLTEKFGLETAKKVQSLINAHGANGDLYKFWLKKNKNLNAYHYSAFKSGARKIGESQLAWTQEAGQEYIVRPSDGAILTPVAKGDSVLTSTATNNIWQMANSPAEFIKDNLNLGATGVPNNSTVQSSYTQVLDNITFNFPNVRSYDEMLTQMQRDKSFERLIMAMTIDKLAGGSSLAKGKAIR